MYNKLDINSGTVNTIAKFTSGDDNGFIQIEDDDTTGYIDAQNGWISIGGHASALHVNNLSINASDGRASSAYTARVWCNFSGIGTPSINQSHNVSSISTPYNAAYTISYTNTLPASWTAPMACGHKAGGNPGSSNSQSCSVGELGYNTSDLTIEFMNGAGTSMRQVNRATMIVFGGS
jgi:hypothetical protein